jgi:hypothetical protein
LAIQTYVPASSSDASQSTRHLTLTHSLPLPRIRISARAILVLVLWLNIATSMVWALDRQSDLQDLGSFLHSGASYKEALNPYEYHFWIHPAPIGTDALNLNPPVSVYLFASLTSLPPQLTAFGFLAGTIALFGLTLMLLLRWFPDKRNTLAVLAVCSLAGVWHTLGYHQIYAPLILAVAASWQLMRRGDLLLAGIAIGMVVAIKPNFVLWPLFLLAAGHPRVAISALATAACISAVPLLLDGPGIYREWLDVTRSFGGLQWTSNASLVSIGARFGLATPTVVIGLAGMAALLVWMRKSRPRVLETSALAVLAVILAGPVSWAGYTLFLLPYLFSRPWNPRIWLVLLMLATPFWMVRDATLLGAISSATLGAVYGWAVLLLFGLVVWDHVCEGRQDREGVREPAA